MSLLNVLFTLDQKLNIDCYDKVDYTKYEYCDTAYSVCTTQLKLVKSKQITFSIYAEARFGMVYIMYYYIFNLCMIYKYLIYIILYIN